MRNVLLAFFVLVLVPISHASTQRVFGHTQMDVLRLDGDPYGTACSLRHTRNDLSNRWCHGFFVKLLDQKLRSRGVNKEISAIAAASLFLPKEFLLDKNPAPADLMIAEYELHEFEQGAGKLAVSLFGDGATVISFEKNF